MKKIASILAIVLLISVIGFVASATISGDFVKLRNPNYTSWNPNNSPWIYYGNDEYVDSNGLDLGIIRINPSGVKVGPINIGPKGVNIGGKVFVDEDWNNFNNYYDSNNIDNIDPKDKMVFGDVKSFDESVTDIKLESINAKVTISKGDINEVRYEGDIDENTHALEVKNTNGKLVVSEKIRKGINNLGKYNNKIQLTLKEEDFNKINLSTISGNVKVERDLSAYQVDLETVSGNIEGDIVKANKINVDTISGNIIFNEFNGDFDYEAVSGSLVGAFTGGKIDIETISGSNDIKLLEDSSLYNIEVEGVSASIDIFGNRYKRSVNINPSGSRKIEIDTVSGNVKIQ